MLDIFYFFDLLQAYNQLVHKELVHYHHHKDID